jgi:hypothetical protein
MFIFIFRRDCLLCGLEHDPARAGELLYLRGGGHIRHLRHASHSLRRLDESRQKFLRIFQQKLFLLGCNGRRKAARFV